MEMETYGPEIIFKYFPETTPEKRKAFESLWPAYTEWNSKINVISRKDIDSLYLHHVLHSLAIAAFFRENMPEFYREAMLPGEPMGTILDFGTGGGFPGIPLAIMFPRIRFTLCDSVGKKIKVAQAVAQAAGLENITAEYTRGEELKGRYDFIVSRAVTSLDVFMQWIRGKYSKGVIYLKGGDIVEEISMAAMKNKLKMKDFSTTPIDKWFKEEYFSEKRVIFVCK